MRHRCPTFSTPGLCCCRHQFTAAPTNGTDMASANVMRPQGRKTILRGETWGQHDPIRGEWTLKPSSHAFEVQPCLCSESYTSAATPRLLATDSVAGTQSVWGLGHCAAHNRRQRCRGAGCGDAEAEGVGAVRFGASARGDAEQHGQVRPHPERVGAAAAGPPRRGGPRIPPPGPFLHLRPHRVICCRGRRGCEVWGLLVGGVGWGTLM